MPRKFFPNGYHATLSCGVAMFMGAFLAASAVLGAEVVLNTAREVRSLTVERAAQKLPVEVRGTVTFIEGPNGAIVLQDDTAGTYFRGRNETALLPGDEVRVTGVTVPGAYLPGIEQATYEKLGRRDLPAALPVSYGDLVSGRSFFQRVAMEGVVQAVSATPDGSRSILSLAMGDGVLEVRVCVPPLKEHGLVDSRVKVEGVASGGINQRRQLVQPIAWVHDWSGVQVLEPALPENRVPVVSAGELLAFDATGQTGRRVRVSGGVIAAFPDGQIFIRDEATALLVQLQVPLTLSVGTRVEVLGFPKMQRFSAALVNATVISQHAAPAPSATEVGLVDIQKGAHDHDLVAVTAVLSGYFREADGDVLLLQDKGRTLRVQSPPLDQALAPGARVRVLGICSVESNTASGVESRPRTVSLRCREAADITVLETASWWTARRLAIVVGVLLFVVILSGLWIALLRRQVRRQTQALRKQIEHEATLEERQRIAREFHDTLEQGLTGLALRLEGVQARGIDEKNGRLLQASRRLISQIQAETRSLVTELREPAPELSDIAAALRGMVEEHPAGCMPVLTLRVVSPIPPLPSRTVHHLRMIAREAVTNALKHACALRVELFLAVENEGLRLRITDDGCGFDPAAQRGGRTGHFGCIGIEERCEKLGAHVHWRSSSQGTSVEIELPLSSDLTSPVV